MNPNSLLLAIDQFEGGQAALDFTIGIAGPLGADVTVLHVRELPRSLRVPPLESPVEARVLVEESVEQIRQAGIPCRGQLCSAREDGVADRIVELSAERPYGGIVLGSLRLTGMRRIQGRGVRDRVMQATPLPVIVAPPALRTGKLRLTPQLGNAQSG